MIVIFLHSLSFATTPLLAFGPFKIFVLSHALQNGWRRSLPLALTPLVADIPVILLVWLVLRQLPEQAIDVLRVTGGLFFFYLALVLYRNARRMAAVANAWPVRRSEPSGRLSSLSGSAPRSTSTGRPSVSLPCSATQSRRSGTVLLFWAPSTCFGAEAWRRRSFYSARQVRSTCRPTISSSCLPACCWSGLASIKSGWALRDS
jgi:hypothetical protein